MCFGNSDCASHDAKLTSHDLRSHDLRSHDAKLNMPESNLDFLVNGLPSYMSVCSSLKRSTFGKNVIVFVLSGDYRQKKNVILTICVGHHWENIVILAISGIITEKA